jgi:hypothetical protein
MNSRVHLFNQDEDNTTHDEGILLEEDLKGMGGMMEML